MTSTGDILENMPIDKWLAELHMECYKKNLEKYNTIKVSDSETRFNTVTTMLCEGRRQHTVSVC